VVFLLGSEYPSPSMPAMTILPFKFRLMDAYERDDKVKGVPKWIERRGIR
jgi:hypothetical protein